MCGDRGFVAERRLTVARPFKGRGNLGMMQSSRERRMKEAVNRRSATKKLFGSDDPGLERPGYSQPSLRDKTRSPHNYSTTHT